MNLKYIKQKDKIPCISQFSTLCFFCRNWTMQMSVFPQREMTKEFRWGYRMNPQIMPRFRQTTGLLQHPPFLHMTLMCTEWGGPPLSLILMLQKPMLRFVYAECTGSDRFISKQARSSQTCMLLSLHLLRASLDLNSWVKAL